MQTSKNTFFPDYAIPPGWILEEELKALGLSNDEFARMCGLSPRLISEIVFGFAPIEPETAIQFERVTHGSKSDLWLSLENSYRLKLAEFAVAPEFAEWIKKFPADELAKRGIISKPVSDTSIVARVLWFFDVCSINTLQDKCGPDSLAFRDSPRFETCRPALATWLRLGEIEAERTECPDYSPMSFRRSLESIRSLTPYTDCYSLEIAQRLCRESGVVLLFVKPLREAAVSGASQWLSPQKPVIQLNARHKSDDHLWFSLFHEAAHILLHEKDQVFIDPIRGEDFDGEPEESLAESQADTWARNFLIPRAGWGKFAGTFLGSEGEIKLFAEEQGISPGIVVGRLQREGRLPWSRLNGLKRKLEWSDPSA